MTQYPFNSNASPREQREALDNDRKQRGATFADFARSDAETPRGRYSGQEKSVLVDGNRPVYPAGPSWAVDPTGPEPSLGADVNEMQPTGEPHEITKSLREPSDTSADGDNSAARPTKSPGRAGPSSSSRRRRI